MKLVPVVPILKIVATTVTKKRASYYQQLNFRKVIS